MRPHNKPLEHTVNEWSLELGKDPVTLRRKLTKLGIKCAPLKKIRGKDIFIALNSDQDSDARRKLRAEADLLEQEVEREAGNTFYWEETQKVVTDYVVLPVSQFISSIPTTYAVRANPMDEEMARNALDQLVEDLKKILRSKLPKPDRE